MLRGLDGSSTPGGARTNESGPVHKDTNDSASALPHPRTIVSIRFRPSPSDNSGTPYTVSGTSRTTLADANETRDWRIFADFAHVLIAIARPLYANDPIGVDLQHSLYALDSTTIDLCLALFPWAKFRKHKAAVKMHTLLDLHGNIPTFIRISDGKLHDGKRGAPAALLSCGRQIHRRALGPDRHPGHRRVCRAYPEALRRISVYVLVAIVRKRLGLEASLYQILQVLSITLFEKTPILRALQACDSGSDLLDPATS